MWVKRYDAGTLVSFARRRRCVRVVRRDKVLVFDWSQRVGVPRADVYERLVETATPQHALFLGVRRQPVPTSYTTDSHARACHGLLNVTQIHRFMRNIRRQ